MQPNKELTLQTFLRLIVMGAFLCSLESISSSFLPRLPFSVTSPSASDSDWGPFSSWSKSSSSSDELRSESVSLSITTCGNAILLVCGAISDIVRRKTTRKYEIQIRWRWASNPITGWIQFGKTPRTRTGSYGFVRQLQKYPLEFWRAVKVIGRFLSPNRPKRGHAWDIKASWGYFLYWKKVAGGSWRGQLSATWSPVTASIWRGTRFARILL